MTLAEYITHVPAQDTRVVLPPITPSTNPRHVTRWVLPSYDGTAFAYCDVHRHDVLYLPATTRALCTVRDLAPYDPTAEALLVKVPATANARRAQRFRARTRHRREDAHVRQWLRYIWQHGVPPIYEGEDWHL